MASRGRKPSRDPAGFVLPGLEEFGTIQDLLRRLAAGDLSTDRRTKLEGALRRQVTDPEELARSSILPSDHPLRAEAHAIADAFAAVTSRRVENAELSLVCVSRRSPLAPWKHLVRAIAAFYRGEDDACDQCLTAVDPDSAPGRLVPALRSALGGQETVKLSGNAEVLAREITGKSPELESALRGLDRAFDAGHSHRITRSIREAVAACTKLRPDLVDRLRQHASIRCVLRNVPSDEVRKAAGGPSLRDSHFWRLLARMEESQGDPVGGCLLWDEFRRQAVHEGLLSPDGPEAAALYFHMATAAGSVPTSLRSLARVRAAEATENIEAAYNDQPESVRAAAAREPRSGPSLVDPAALYEKSASLDPSPDVFRSWIAWASRSGSSWKEVDRAAIAWQESDPGNVEPILVLIDSAVERNAYAKALKYLELAERANEFHPQVRGARVRLGLLTFSKHIDREKYHLAEKDLAALAKRSESGSKERTALISALRWMLARSCGNRDEAKEHEKDTILLLRSVHGGVLLLHGVSALCGRPLPFAPRGPLWPREGAQPEDIAALGTTCALARGVGIPIRIPTVWNKGLAADVAKHSDRIDPHFLRSIAEVALDGENFVAGYAVSGAGLRAGGALVPRFLLLRARALPRRCRDRSLLCLAAAAALADRQGNREVLEEIGRARDVIAGFSAFDDSEQPLDPEDVEEIVRSEALDLRFPAPGASRKSGTSLPARVAERASDLFAAMESMPPEIVATLLNAVHEGISQGHLPAELAELNDEVLAFQLLADLLDEPTGSRKGRRRRGGRSRR